MKIKIFTEITEYINWNIFNYDFFVVYFAVTVEPTHNVPILRLFKSYNDAKERGFSTIVATNGWSYENFYRCDDNDIENFCKLYLEDQIDLSKIPNKQKLHNPIYASDTVINNRKNICNTCEFNINNICGLCGCDLIKKVKFKKESCPMNKWETGITPNQELKNLTKGCGCNNG